MRRLPPLSHRRGTAAEDRALAHLKEAGLRLLVRNYRTRGGEIDLVMVDAEETVFVEVRRRSRGGYGGAAVSITAAKRRRLEHAARHYLQRHGERPCRFDVVAVDGEEGRLQWLRDAFRAGE